jgi:predicted metalloprotease with PDZ domain
VANLEDASWNVWLRGENSLNANVPYQLKGKIAGMLLDAEIRGRTGGQKSIDDVLRYLLTQSATRRGGLADSALEPAIQTATGLNVSEFFEKVVRGKGELEYNRYLQPLGVTAASRKAPATLQFGIEFERIDSNQARIRRVIAGSPAEAAKLDFGDVIVAMDDDRVTFDNLASRIHSKPLGKPVNLTVMRGERLLNLTITAGLAQSETWAVEETLQPTPEQVRLKNAWLPQRRGGK